MPFSEHNAIRGFNTLMSPNPETNQWETKKRIEQTLVDLYWSYAPGTRFIIKPPENELQQTIIDTMANNIVQLRNWYPYLDRKSGLIDWVNAVQIAYPDIEIAQWFYTGIEKTVMNYVSRGDEAHTAFMGLLMNDYTMNDTVVSDFSDAFARMPQAKRALASDVFPLIVHTDHLYHVLWDMSHAVFPIIGVDDSLFSSWVTRPIKRDNELMIAKNLKQLIWLHATQDTLPDSVQHNLGIRQFGKFDRTMLVSANVESRYQLNRDYIISFLSSFRDKDLPVHETEYMYRELSRHKSLKNTGMLAYEIDGSTQLHDALTTTTQKANKQAIILLKGHSQKEQFSDIPTEELYNVFADIRSQTSIPILLIMAACGVGKRSGTAFEVSKAGIQVISSNDKSYITDIKLQQKKATNIGAQVTYSSGQTVVYVNGAEVDRY